MRTASKFWGDPGQKYYNQKWDLDINYKFNNLGKDKSKLIN